MSHTELVQDLCTFLDESPSPWHGADSARRRLEAAGYTRLQETEHWHFAAGKYYVMRGGSAIVAFRIPASPVHGWKIALAHSDRGWTASPPPVTPACLWRATAE